MVNQQKMSFLFSLTKPLHQDCYDDRDRKRDEIFSLKKINESFRRRINILEDDKTNLTLQLLDCEKNRVRMDLSQFETNRTYKVNGTRIKLNQWLNDAVERGHVEDWLEQNIDVSLLTGTLDEQALGLRKLIFAHFGNKDIHVKETKDTWQKPSEFIEGGLKGDCDDWATFLFYCYQVVFHTTNKAYFALVGLNYKEGFNWGNHATILWLHSDGNFYVLESAVEAGSTYIENSLDAFGELDYRRNFKYGRVVYLSDTKNNYYQVVI